MDRAELRRKRRYAAVRVEEDHSPLVSLKNADLRALFEPSMIEGYAYMVREPVCAKIERIGRKLEEQGMVLVIRSVWRSFDHQTRLWEDKAAVMRRDHPDRHEDEIKEIVSRFVAPPRESMHATGGAVDALIYDPKASRVLDFGNNEGLKLELDETCYPHHPGVSAEARKNRNVLMQLFEDEGFLVDCQEYWHFDYENVSWAAGSGKTVARFGVIEELTA